MVEEGEGEGEVGFVKDILTGCKRPTSPSSQGWTPCFANFLFLLVLLDGLVR